MFLPPELSPLTGREPRNVAWAFENADAPIRFAEEKLGDVMVLPIVIFTMILWPVLGASGSGQIQRQILSSGGGQSLITAARHARRRCSVMRPLLGILDAVGLSCAGLPPFTTACHVVANRH
jgi:hypothetical protein